MPEFSMGNSLRPLVGGQNQVKWPHNAIDRKRSLVNSNYNSPWFAPRPAQFCENLHFTDHS